MSGIDIDVKDFSHDQWLEQRRKGVGGSDVATIMGSGYATELELYNDKMGIAPPWGGNEKTKWGNRLENNIAEHWAEESGREIVKETVMRVNPDYPICQVNIDRQILPVDDKGPGNLQIKNVGEMTHSKWEDDLPLYMFFQFQWELAATGWRFGEFGILVGGNNFLRVPLKRDEALIQEMLKKANNWWQKHIVAKVPPPLSGKELSKKTDYPQGVTSQVGSNVKILCDEYLEINGQLKDLEEEKSKIKNLIQVACGDADFIEWDGKVLASFRLGKGSTYTTVKKASRSLLVKKPKKQK